DKKQPAKKQGGQGRSRNRFGTGGQGRFPVNSEHLAANQHCQTLWKPDSRPKPLTVCCQSTLPCPVLNDKCGRPQCQKLVRRADLVCALHPPLEGRRIAPTGRREAPPTFQLSSPGLGPGDPVRRGF